MSGNVHSKNLREKIDGFIAAEYKYLYESLPSMDKDMVLIGISTGAILTKY